MRRMHRHVLTDSSRPCCPRIKVSAAAGCIGPRAPAAHAQNGKGSMQKHQPRRGCQPGSTRHSAQSARRSSSAPAASADDDSGFDLELDSTPRTVVLPWWLNSPGKTFCLAGLLKILVIMSRAVPWAGVTTPAGLEAAATMIPFGIVLVLLARAAVDRGLTVRWWLTPLLLCSAAAFLFAQHRFFPPKRIVAAAPDPAIVAAQERRQLAAAAARRKLPTAQDADRLWDKYEKAKALQEAAELGAAKQ